jgi:hypothetical protein
MVNEDFIEGSIEGSEAIEAPQSIENPLQRAPEKKKKERSQKQIGSLKKARAARARNIAARKQKPTTIQDTIEETSQPMDDGPNVNHKLSIGMKKQHHPPQTQMKHNNAHRRRRQKIIIQNDESSSSDEDVIVIQNKHKKKKKTKKPIVVVSSSESEDDSDHNSFVDKNIKIIINHHLDLFKV